MLVLPAMDGYTWSKRAGGHEIDLLSYMRKKTVLGHQKYLAKRHYIPSNVESVDVL